jgi:hypothetical protein
MWSLRGPNQIVKVIPGDMTVAHTLGGYITLGKYLINKTPTQIEKDLGLKHGYLIHGAKIYRFTRLPQISEYEYDLTANFPGGLAYYAGSSSDPYPAGSRIIHQWRIRTGVHIPVDSGNFLDLMPGQLFPSSWLYSG